MKTFSRRKLASISFFLALAALLLSALWIGFYIRVYSPFQMDRDESHHANRGLDIASAIQRASIKDFWHETIKPDWYPPIHGHFLAAWFLLVSPNTVSARLYATFCYILLGLLLWISSRQTFPKIHPLLYLTPVLFLILDEQHLIHAAMSMLELPAMLLAMVSLFFFIRSLKDPRPAILLLTSLFALLTFLTRYSHGIFLLISLGICYLIFSRREFKGQYVKIILAWLPTFLVLLLWLFGLDQWQWLKSYADVQPQQVGVWSLQDLLFYPLQLLKTTSGWLPLLLIGFEITLWIRGKPVVREALPYLVFFCVSLVMLSVRLDNISRFGMVLLPPLWVVAAGGSADLIGLVKKPAIQLTAIGGWLTLLALLGVKNILALPGYLDTAYENTNPGVNDAYDLIAQTVNAADQDHLSIVMYGNTDQWNATGLHFYLQAQCMATNPKCQIEVQGERELYKSWPPQNLPRDVINQRIEDALAAADYLVVIAKSPVIPDGWQEIKRGEFVFARHTIGNKTFQVVILEPE